jgi:LacI family transcriptional regulator
MVTLRDVAAATGVSISTASRALSDHEYVKSETRARVQAAARELGYEPNALARGLRRNRTRTIGIVMPDMRNSSFSSVAAPYLQRQLQEYGYGMVVYVTGNDRETELLCLERLRDQEVDGVIHVPLSASSAEFLTEGPRPIPVVEMFRQTTSAKLDAVVYDDAAAASSLMGHLLDLNHRQIGVITGTERLDSSQRRLAGAYRAVAAADLPADTLHVVHAQHSPDAGRLAFRRLFAENPQITAVLATSTQFMLGAALASQELGLPIPERLSLVGFGDPEWSALISPPLTTFSLPLEEMAMTAALMMISRIERPTSSATPPTRIVFSGNVIVRGSTSTPNPS